MAPGRIRSNQSALGHYSVFQEACDTPGYPAPATYPVQHGRSAGLTGSRTTVVLPGMSVPVKPQAFERTTQPEVESRGGEGGSRRASQTGEICVGI
jgi:hypothetical protein